jgi:hypothetical protein
MFELWDTESRNIIATFSTEARALGMVRRALEMDGPELVESLLLMHEDEHGQSRTIARGQDLAARALAASRRPQPRTRHVGVH